MAKKATRKKTAGEKPVRKKTTHKKTIRKRPQIKKTARKKTSVRVSTNRLTQTGEYMSPQQVAHFRRILQKWQRDLLEGLDDTIHHLQDEAANFPDPTDRATQEEEFTLGLRTRDRERKLIEKIDEALLALDTGEYGYCEVCGIEIGVSRLEARPTATLCIDCKTLDEIKNDSLANPLFLK